MVLDYLLKPSVNVNVIFTIHYGCIKDTYLKTLYFVLLFLFVLCFLCVQYVRVYARCAHTRQDESGSLGESRYSQEVGMLEWRR